MKTKLLPLSLAALTLSFAQLGYAQDTQLLIEELPAIDTTIAPFDEIEDTSIVITTKPKKELTEDEQQEAKQLQKQAVKIYSNLLTYKSKSQLKSVARNLEYLKEALTEAQTRLKIEVTNYKSLNKDVYIRKKQIDRMEASQELKDRRLIDLKESYEQRKYSMVYSLNELKKRITTLRERIAIYQGEKNDLDIIHKESGAKRDLTWAEKDRIQKSKALDTFDQIEDELINKEFDNYLK